MARRVATIKKSVEIEDIFNIVDKAKVEEVKQELKVYQSVYDVLRKYKGFVRALWKKEDLIEYFAFCEKNGIVAIDTETNDSVDARSAICIGLCLYTPLRRPVYIPINHLDKLTGERIKEQADPEFIQELLKTFLKTKNIYHNAKFDINVIDTNFRIRLPLYWDTMVGCKLMDENRRSARLKDVYRDEIEPAQPTYNIKKLFEANQTADIEKFALYSAMDPYETYQLYLKQYEELKAPSMQKLANLFKVEMRICEISGVMEQEGANIDIDLCKQYRDYFQKLVDEAQEKINEYFKELKPKAMRKELPEWPINVASSDQTVKAFGMMGIDIKDSKEETMSALAKVEPIAKTILDYRSNLHMITSFLDPYIKMAHPKTGRIHAKFNQLGDEDKTIVTGRFSSKEPNLQQVPAFDDSVRLCFNGGYIDDTVDVEDEIKLFALDFVQTQSGLKRAIDLGMQDEILSDDGSLLQILQISENKKVYKLRVKEVV